MAKSWTTLDITGEVHWTTYQHALSQDMLTVYVNPLIKEDTVDNILKGIMMNHEVSTSNEKPVVKQANGVTLESIVVGKDGVKEVKVSQEGVESTDSAPVKN